MQRLLSDSFVFFRKTPVLTVLFFCLFSVPSESAAAALPDSLSPIIIVPLALLLIFLSAYVLILRRKLHGIERQMISRAKTAGPEDRPDHIPEHIPEHIKDDFLSGISHELRTPLVGIIGISDALLTGVAGPLSPELRKNLIIIAGSCRRLSNMVNNVLDFTRLKHRDIDLKFRPVRIQQLADIVIAFSEPFVSGKNIRLLNLIEPDFPPLHADEDRLQQILYNLVGNAIRFSHTGKVEISCRIADKDNAEIIVSDTGSGIPADRLENIFEIEERVASEADDFSQSGISLSVTRKLVQMHGGSIRVTSEKDKGSSFFFTIPLSHESIEADECSAVSPISCVLDPESCFPESSDSWETDAKDGLLSCTEEIRAEYAEKSARILVVDDDPVHLQVVLNFLIVQQYEVITATDGNDALEHLRNNARPDLILMDVVMPGKSGFEVCREIREKYSPSELPIIMLTAKNQVSDLVKGFECGANDYLTKPVSHRELVSRVRTHINLNLSDRALRESERKYREIFENVFDFWFSHNLEGNIIETNLPYKEGWGYENEDVTRMNIKDFLIASNAERFESYMDQLLREGKAEGLVCCVTRDGVERMLDYRTALICDEKGQALSIRGTARDVTERIQFEKEKKELEKQIRQAQKMQAIGTLAGGIAHDFNNILFPIIGYTEMALENLSPGNPTRSDLEEVLRAANRAADLVRQILTFARQTEDEWKPLHIQPVIKEALKLLKASLPSTIKIQDYIKDDTDSVMADPTQIHQVIMNLCTNAYHALRQKGGRLTVSLDSLNIRADHPIPVHDMCPGPWYRLTVSDTGSGMPPDVVERIFDPYFTTKPMGEGTGMGLAMVHRIVNNFRGHVTVSSREGEGSVFHVWLPRIESEEGEKEALALSAGDIIGGRERILVVDDEQQIVDMMHKSLTGLGYDVTVRYSSPDALEAFRVNPDRFDLVITDQTMPNLTGAEFCRQLLRLRPDVRIILCTGFSDLISRRKAFELGIRGFIMKPVNKTDLARTIRSVLDGEEDVG